MESTHGVHVRPASFVAFTPMAPEELAGVTEIAQILGIARRTAAVYVDRPDFPQPVGVLARGRVWRTRDVERWAKKNPRRPPGRPKRPE
jgi:prophage regulatory protein